MSSSNWTSDLLCEFCGDLPATTACSASGCKRLCGHCDSIWHGHPARVGHVRDQLMMPMAQQVGSGSTWLCPHCTFKNRGSGSNTSDRSVCAMCSKSSQFVSASPALSDEADSGDEADRDEDVGIVGGAAQLPCPACTLLNPASAAVCQLCQSQLAGIATTSNANNLHGPLHHESPPIKSMIAEERRMLDRVNRLEDELAAAAGGAGSGHRPAKIRHGLTGCCGGQHALSPAKSRK